MSVNTGVRQRVKKKTGRKRMSTISPKTKKAYVKLVEGNSIDLFDVGGNN